MKRFLILTMIMAACTLAWGGNSIFSYDGMPVRYYGNDVYGLSMGDTGLADSFRYNSGFGNPALHNSSNRSLFATGMIFGFTNYASENSAGAKQTYLDNSLDLPYLSISIPVKRHRLGLQINSHSSGLVNNQVSYTTEDELKITETHKMDRYLYRGDLIYSMRTGHFSMGASANYYFGHDIRYFKQDAGFTPYNTTEELSRSYKGPSFTLGAMAYYDVINAGMYFSPQISLKGSSNRMSLHTNEPDEDYEYQIPWELGLGASILPKAEHKLNIDMHYEAWNQIDAQMNDGIKVGMGWAYEPLAQSKDSYLKKLPLRAGISWRSLPFKVKQEAVEEYALSFGISFPLKRDVNRLDLGFQALQRGSLEANQMSDRSFMFMIGFAGFDVIGKASDRTIPREIPVKEELGL